MQEKAIVAITTGTGGAVGMVRLSGADIFEIAEKVFSPSFTEKPLSEMKGYTACMGRVGDGDGEFDEAIATVFLAPKSYTGEDVIEFTCHGGAYLLDRLVIALVSAGARLAEPGEFTRRAYMNGKLSLDRAEAVADLISSHSMQANKAALIAKDGALFKAIDKITQNLLDIAAHLSAWIDYPEEGVEDLTEDELLKTLTTASLDLDKLTVGYAQGRIIKEGIDTAIIGSPNVGKSTLMNLLSGSSRSIVTHIAGTTRDVVEETAMVGNLKLKLADTAGIRTTDDLVEQIGVERSLDKINTSQLILAVFDGSTPLTEDENELIVSLKDKTTIAVINKSDIGLKIDCDYIASYIPNIVYISAKNADGLTALEENIATLLHTTDFDPTLPMIANQRQLECVTKAKTALKEATDAITLGITLDAVSVCNDEAIDALLELTGQKATIAVVDRVFENFCVGK